MNPSGQNLGVNLLPGPAEAATTADISKSNSAPSFNDKLLKNRGFSDYLQDRKAADKSAARDPNEDSVEAAAANTGSANTTENQTSKRQSAANSGSTLPNDGSKLPSGQTVKTTTSILSLLQKGLSFKAQMANNSLDIAATDNAFVELKDIASTTVTSTPLTTEITQAYRSLNSAGLSTTVSIPVGKPGWSESVMQRVMWMSSQNISRAEIALNPPELGPMNIKISSTGDQASVVFSSHHGSVREALDQGLARLREMMENQGINLADVDVSDQSTFQQRDQAEVEGASGEGGVDGQLADNNHEQFGDDSVAMTKPLALVDQYV